jgi:cyclomaltodextrinase / maltogenic alpha-amylase / neopullulanase
MVEITTPAWVHNAVFYQIFPDRFAFSKEVVKPSNLEAWDTPPTVYGFKGGDLLGVLEKLDYLQDLGINAIYFNPIFQSASSHRYHTHDYYQVDPLLGGNQAFARLLKEAHRRNIRIVLDGVFNHASRGFFPFNHVLECGSASPYVDWFDIKGYPLNAYGPGKANYRCWVGLPALPELNTKNPQVRQYIMDIARYWLEQGSDGWRLDVPFCIDDDSFWQEFRQVVKAANPEGYIVGEVPWEAQRWLQGDQFDAVMNYQFTQLCVGFFAGEGMDRHYEKGMMGLPDTQVLDAPAFARRAEALLRLYPSPIAAAQLNLLDSHDMPRFLSIAGGDKATLKLAALFMLTYPGAPCIYYGDEVGIVNGPTRTPEDCRFTFPWDESKWDHDLRDFYKRCIDLRLNHAALRTGGYKTIYAEGKQVAFERQLDGERVLMAINNGREPWRLELGVQAMSGVGKGLLQGWEAIIKDGKMSGLTLPPRSGEVFLI